MSLYSSDTLSNAGEGDSNSGSNQIEPEKGVWSDGEKELSWCYCFVFYSQIGFIEKKISERFRTYIHKSITYKREKHGVKQKKRPTIPGLIFIQGIPSRIEAYLKDNIPGVYLSKDCVSHKAAVIPHRKMQVFMRISEIDPDRIRFMPHSFDYYSSGHVLVKVTSGVLAGMEGYQVRISRNKCFITTLGGVTLAISGISKETFENVEEYIQYRHQAQMIESEKNHAVPELLELSKEISSCFFVPKSQLDLFAMTRSLEFWYGKARNAFLAEDFDSAADILFQVLKSTGLNFTQIYNDPSVGDFKDIAEACREIDKLLCDIQASPKSSQELKEKISAERQNLKREYSFLPLKK